MKTLERAKKLLIVNSSNQFWGAEISLSIFLKGLTPSEFSLIIKADGNGFSEYLTKQGISFEKNALELSPRKITFIKSIFFLLKASFREKATNFYGNNEDLSTLLAIIRVLSFFKIKTSIHIRNSPNKFDYYKKLMFVHSNIICNSKYTKKSLTKSVFLHPKSQIHLIPNAHGQKHTSNNNLKIQKTSLQKLNPFFLTVGMINRRKAQLDVVEAFYDADIHLKARYLMLGKSNEKNLYLEEIENFINKHDLESSIFIRSFEKDLEPFYSNAIATIVPSINETFGRVIVESGFYGTPLIVRDIEPLNELIEHGKTGLLWDGTTTHLAQLADIILKDTNYRNFLGKNLRIKVLNDFSDCRYIDSVKSAIQGKLT